MPVDLAMFQRGSLGECSGEKSESKRGGVMGLWVRKVEAVSIEVFKKIFGG